MVLLLAPCYQVPTSTMFDGSQRKERNPCCSEPYSVLPRRNRVAHYPLRSIKQLVTEGRYLITVTALETAALMGFDDQSIVECIVGQLAESHFYKTMPATSVPGLMQDVYKISFEGQRVYLKLQINRSQNAVVISFKQDESVF